LGKTVSIRKKDTQYDYRFMPEPNLLPCLVYPLKSFTPLKLKDEGRIVCTRNHELIVNEDYLDQVRNISSVKCFVDLDKARDEFESKKLPHMRRQHLVDAYQINPDLAFTFVAHDLDALLIEIVDQFKAPVDEIPIYANLLRTRYLHVQNLNINLDKMSSRLRCQKIVSYVNDVLKANLVNNRVRGQLFIDLFNQDEHLHKMASDLIKEKNLAVIKDAQLIRECIQKLFAENEKSIIDYKVSKEKKRAKTFDMFVTRVHKNFNETTDPDLVNELVAEALKNSLQS
jgi:Asp-tRNA(Asn)/Glu-tRNA(Gln) amidotransferase B subunit